MQRCCKHYNISKDAFSRSGTVMIGLIILSPFISTISEGYKWNLLIEL